MKRVAYIVGLLLVIGIALPIVATADIDDVYYWQGASLKNNQTTSNTNVVVVDSVAAQQGTLQRTRIAQPKVEPINTEVVLDQDTIVKIVVHKQVQ